MVLHENEMSSKKEGEFAKVSITLYSALLIKRRFYHGCWYCSGRGARCDMRKCVIVLILL